MRRVPFDLADCEAVWKEWQFNCGPAALCAVLNMTPAELRPHLRDFEKKGYTNPTLMQQVLRDLRTPWRRFYRSDSPDQWRAEDFNRVPLGLMRVQ